MSNIDSIQHWKSILIVEIWVCSIVKYVFSRLLLLSLVIKRDFRHFMRFVYSNKNQYSDIAKSKHTRERVKRKILVPIPDKGLKNSKTLSSERGREFKTASNEFDIFIVWNEYILDKTTTTAEIQHTLLWQSFIVKLQTLNSNETSFPLSTSLSFVVSYPDKWLILPFFEFNL